jgi:hypothetical protein
VADPPQHEHYAPEDVPWEEEYSRMRPRDDIFLGGGAEDAAPEPDGVTREGEGGGSFEEVLADILGFPFRGLGWILQGVF